MKLRTTIYLNKNLYKRLKIKLVQLEISFSEWIESVIERFLNE